ncbi:hypothetical protein UFOVP201_40 [uncultured Caudovirales phage]|uniref:Holin n=1 Tax=uncultured Caudovirales phage TaxID=2100421 RepID=A0A6J7WJP1_9CAUD|nr:hypothetical protein UFOVP201_40 [uncultured Caudovirales phage]
MDPVPLSSNDQFKDVAVASGLGGLSMIARLLLSTERVSFGWVCRRVLAAAITASIVGLAIQDHVTSVGLKMAIAGASGYAAPEVLDYLILRVRSLKASKASRL